MAQFFKKILCPVDFDEPSGIAVEYAGNLAKENHAKLYLLHVVAGVIPVVTEAPARAELANMAAQHLRGSADFEVLTSGGNPAEEILKAAKEHDVDLVLMATHGRRGLGRLVLGSVTERVTREAPCPVLVVRPSPSES